MPDTIDERVLNKGKLNTFQKTENNNVVINSAKAIGCSVVNIGSQDLLEGREHLVLGLVWQIIKIGLFAKVDLKHHPELFRLLEQGETLDDLLKVCHVRMYPHFNPVAPHGSNFVALVQLPLEEGELVSPSHQLHR